MRAVCYQKVNLAGDRDYSTLSGKAGKRAAARGLSAKLLMALDGVTGAPHHRGGIAFVPENRRLFPRLSVRDNLRLGSA